MTRLAIFAFASLLIRAEVRTLTLKEAVDLAVRQNPNLVMARLDRLKTQLGVDIVRDPFMPKIYGGSGAAWTSGFPQTINGNPPSIFEARVIMSIYNRPQSFLVAQARENVRGAEIDVQRQQDDIVYRTASLFMDAVQIGRSAVAAQKQVQSLAEVLDEVRQRVAEGRELPIQGKRAELDAARARQHADSLVADRENAEASLALVLGFSADDTVHPADSEQLDLVLPESEETTVAGALANNKQVQLLQSQMQAKGLEVKSYQSARWPQIDLIAQYSLLAKYNFEDFYNVQKFQYNNGILGASFTFPLLVGKSSQAYAAQGEADLAKLRTQYGTLRNQITADSRKAFRDVRRATAARDIAKLDLDVAREQLNVTMAQHEEGRVSIRDVETTRIQESDKWLAYYQAQNELERARLNLLRETGTLAAALK
jgi:outer membrane protein TolC